MEPLPQHAADAGGLRRRHADDARRCHRLDPVVLGTFAHSGVLQTAVRGGWLYAATKTDLFIADVHQAFTTPATALPATPPSTTLSIQGQQLGPVVLSGSYLFTAGRTGNFIAALDVSTPLSPVVLSTVTISNSAFSGYPGLQTLVPGIVYHHPLPHRPRSERVAPLHGVRPGRGVRARIARRSSGPNHSLRLCSGGAMAQPPPGSSTPQPPSRPGR